MTHSLIIRECSGDYDVIVLTQRYAAPDVNGDIFVGVFSNMEKLMEYYEENIKHKKAAQGVFYANPVQLNKGVVIYAV